MMNFRFTPAVKVFSIGYLAAFLVQQTADQFLGANLLGLFALVPAGFLGGYLWQLFTYSFLQTDVMHLFLNLMLLVFIGAELEGIWGTRRFVKFYFFCSVIAGLFYLLIQKTMGGENGVFMPLVGAAGAVYGLLIAYGFFFGERTLLFMMLFPMKAKYFIWVLAGMEFLTTVYSRSGGAASLAPLAGMGAGFIYVYGDRIIQTVGFPKTPKKRKLKPGHLKLVIDRDTKRIRTEMGAPDDEGPDHKTPKTWH